MKKRKNQKSSKAKNYAALPLANNPIQSFLSPSIQLVLLSIVTVAVYSLTLDVPYYLDDFSTIRDNLAIRDIGNLQAIYAFAPQRFISYFSFALNFSIHEYDLAGYHMVNIAVHLANSLLVFKLASLLLKLVAADRELGPELLAWFPLLAALLFALHPLQTQAVTYIVQRSASLAATFYLLSVLFYLQARLHGFTSKSYFYIAALGLSALCAVYTKQNTVTIPASLMLVEIVFFGFGGRKLINLIVGAALLAFLFFITLTLFTDGAFFQSLSSATQETELVTRGQYLAVQMGVLWTYLLKFFIPVGIHLEYDIPITSFAEVQVWLLLAMHALLIAVGFKLIRIRPMIAFAILFYYLAHAVESSVIPIRDFAFEHRTYLPNFGLCLMASWLALEILPKVMGAQKTLLCLVAVVMILAGLTVLRNNQWRDPIAFFTHETALSPTTLRSWSMLAESHLRLQENEKAAEVYEQGAEFLESTLDRQNNTEVAYYENYALALDRIGKREEALDLIRGINVSVLPARNQSKFLMLKGNIFANQQQYVLAELEYIEALKLDNLNQDARLNIGKIQYINEDYIGARTTFIELLELDSQHVAAIEAKIILDTIDEAFGR